MYAPQLFPRRLLQSLVSVLLFNFLTSLAQDDEQFAECYNYLYNCGPDIQNIRYPFWGDTRLSFCGLEGFHLRCINNNYSTIDINNQPFRVLRINQSNRSMTIARNDLWEDICPPPEFFRNTALNENLFRYGLDLENENLTLFYNCSSGVNETVRSNFTCWRNGVESIGFFGDESFSERGEACGMNMSVPVLRSALDEFRNNNSNGEMRLRELLNGGFNVEYIIDDDDCSACQRSGGLCWYSANSPQSRCLCPNGPHRSVCRSSDNGLAVRLKLIIGLGAASIVLLSVCSIIYCIMKHSKTTSLPFWKRETESSKKIEAFIEQYGSLTPRRYRYSDVKKITNSFRHELGRGGYGSVYKGRLADGRVVAVKVLNTSKGNGEDFINEVASIGRTCHVNVVALLGFCYEPQKRALIYEFMSNGSLEKFIYHKTPLSTDQHLGGEKLYEIALGIARGLEYLHRGCNTRILHFDIKPHNILLDEDFCPKISDFGLAKLYPKKESIVSMVGVRGTIGYIAPEVFSRNFGGVSHKSDVYSYGMMVLEMVGGRKNIDAEVCHTSEIYFPHWIYNQLEQDQDLQLQGLMTIEENEIAKKMILVGLWCIQTDPSQRPSMNKVIGMLEGSMEALKIPPKPFLYSSPPQSPPHSPVLPPPPPHYQFS